MEDLSVIFVGFFCLLLILILFFVIPVVLARWIFRINEQIDLLSQIKDELRKLRLKKYPDKRPDDVNSL